MSGPTAVIDRMYRSFAAGDIAAVLGSMSPDIVWNEAENFPYADRNPYVGPEAIATGLFARIAADFDGFALEVQELIDGGDTVVGLGRYVGTSRRTGQALRAQFAHVWRVAGGKVTRFQQYADTLQATRVAGTNRATGP